MGCRITEEKEGLNRCARDPRNELSCGLFLILFVCSLRGDEGAYEFSLYLDNKCGFKRRLQP